VGRPEGDARTRAITQGRKRDIQEREIRRTSSKTRRESTPKTSLQTPFASVQKKSKRKKGVEKGFFPLPKEHGGGAALNRATAPCPEKRTKGVEMGTRK